MEDGVLKARDPIAPELPSVYEVYETMNGSAPSGIEWDAFQGVASVTYAYGLTGYMHPDVPQEVLDIFAETVAAINADPAAFDGEVVQVEGTIVEICSNMGCWVELRDAEDNAVTVKVDDGVVDFREFVAEKQYMVAEGVFQTAGEHGAQVYIMEHGAVVAD